MSAAVPPELAGLTFVRHLGSGGFADVFLYQQHRPERLVAVKVLRAAGLAAAQTRRFAVEANAMAALGGHPYIVQVYSADVAPDGRPYLSMTYYPRPNLAERAARAPLSVAEVLRIGVQIGSALETMHRRRLLHRDVKPGNVLTSEFGVPGLADFGIAGTLGVKDSDPDLGVSVHYAPPEVLFATADPTVASDVYSFGATLWTLLVGRKPFSVPGNDDVQSVFARIGEGSALPIDRMDALPSLRGLVAQSMYRDPDRRPRSMIEFVYSLQQIEQEYQLPVTAAVVDTSDAVVPADGASASDRDDDRTVIRPVLAPSDAPSVVTGGSPATPAWTAEAAEAARGDATTTTTGTRAFARARRRFVTSSAVLISSGVGLFVVSALVGFWLSRG